MTWAAGERNVDLARECGSAARTRRREGCRGWRTVSRVCRVRPSDPEALEIARNHDEPIDLLITDIAMPHMLGAEAAERIRAIKPGIAVLYMSGYAWPVHASQGRLDPDTVIVEKPFSDTDLLAKAGQALGGHDAGLRTSQGTRARPTPGTGARNL